MGTLLRSTPLGSSVGTSELEANAVTFAKVAANLRTYHLRGSQGVNPNILVTQIGYIYPHGYVAVSAGAGGTGARRFYIEEGTWALGIVSFRLLNEAMGATDTCTWGVAKNGVSLGTVTYNDGDAVGLEKTLDLTGQSVTVDDYLSITYEQNDAVAQDNRASWDIPMERTA